MDKATSPRSRPAPTDLAAYSLLLVGPLFAFLTYHGYPFLRAEVVLLTMGLLVVVTLLARLPHKLRPLMFWLLIVLFMDIQLDLIDFRNVFDPTALFVPAVVAGGAVWMLRSHIGGILTAMLLAFYASHFAVTPSQRISAWTQETPRQFHDEHLPPIIHLVLDEFSGLEGLPTEIDSTLILKRDLISFYESNGFRILGGAYTRYRDTHTSLAHALNFVPTDTDDAYLEGRGERTLEQNEYFEQLVAMGYRIQVYQSQHFDLCHPKDVRVASCLTYPANSARGIAQMTLPFPAKAAFVADYLLSSRSSLWRATRHHYRTRLRPALAAVGMGLPAWEWVGGFTPSSLTPTVMARILDDLSDTTGGTLIFGHLLMPHSPYLYDSNCRAHREFGKRLSFVTPPDTLNASARATRYELYAQQVRCLTHQLEEFLASADSLLGPQRPLVILHGDHGSRIAINSGVPQNRDRLTVADINDVFSTFFAIRSATMRPAYDTTPLALDEILQQLVQSHFESDAFAMSEPGYVYLSRWPGEPLVRVDLADVSRK